MKKEGKFNHEQHVYVDISQVYHPIFIPQKKKFESLVYIALSDTCNAAFGATKDQPFPMCPGFREGNDTGVPKKTKQCEVKVDQAPDQFERSCIIPKVNKGPGFMLDFDKVSNTWCLKSGAYIYYIYLEYGFGLHHLSWIWFTHVMGKCVGKVDDLTI